MFRATILSAITIATVFAAGPGSAAVAHKWVDEKGVTHYSDEPPAAQGTGSTQIELPQPVPATGTSPDNYYSIANQWARTNQERLEREKLRLQADQARAASKPAVTNVYVNQQREGYGVVWRGIPRKHHRKHKRGHSNSSYTYRSHQSKYPPGLHPGRKHGASLKLTY